MIMACPVAFGEISVKSRIRGVLSYKKPAFWLIALSALSCLLLACCFLTDPIPCLHSFQGEITVAATCTEQGIRTNQCRHCQYTYAEPVEQHPHHYDGGTVTTAPSCTQTGILTYRCTDCPAQMTQVLERTEHIAGEPYTVIEANCSQTGQVRATCTQCGAEFVTQILEKNAVHDLQETVVRQATCSQEGEGIRQCSRCSYAESCVYEKLPHDYEKTVMSQANCRDYASIRYRCRDCQFTIAEKGDQLGDHSWTYTGYKETYFCIHCGHFDKRDSESYDMFDDVVGPKPTVPTLPVIRWDIP